MSTTPNLFREGDVVAEGFDEIFAGYTHSPDHQRAAVVALLDPQHPPETIEQLKSIARNLKTRFRLAPGSESVNERDRLDGRGSVNGDGVLVGEPVLVHDGLSLIERDGNKLATMTITLLSIVLLVSLADVRFVLLTALTILWSVVVTRALMVGIGVQLSLVSSVLTAIVTVIAVTAVLHLGIRFRAAVSRGDSPQTATTQTLARLLPPIFWTCATDAAGFFALRVSRIAPIQQFGLMIGASAIAVFVSLILFSAVSMTLPRFPRAFADGGSSNQSLQQRLARTIRRACVAVANHSISHPSRSLTVAAFAALVACFGLGRIETDTSFLNNFRSHSQIARAYREVETNFGGAGVWDIVLDAPEELSPDFLDQVRDLEDQLRAIEIEGASLAKVLSLADAEAVVARSTFAEFLPTSSRLSAMYVALPGFFNALLSRSDDGARKLRIMLRSREQLESKQKTALIAEVERVVHQRTTSDRWVESVGKSREGRVTGYYVLMSRLISQLIGDQWRCFAASSLLVWLLLVLATRSVRLASAALLPNLLPIVLVLAVVGLLGGRMNMGAAMIAAVSIGISIDSSVHLLINYRRNRLHGHSVKGSATMAAGNVGVPVLLATCALIVGFGVLATSEFVPTATFGLLVAVTMALGTIVNLTLLPALITMVEGPKARGSSVVHDS
jgi:predicted RND superfamily exporter protein